MHESKFAKYVGKIVCLDLVNGQQVVCRIEEVLAGDQYGKRVAIKNPVLIHLSADEHTGQLKMGCIPYGGPLFEIGKTEEVDLGHIIFILKCPPQVEQMYMKVTTGLVTPPQSSLIV